jgi:hypothetical protein
LFHDIVNHIDSGEVSNSTGKPSKQALHQSGRASP